MTYYKYVVTCCFLEGFCYIVAGVYVVPHGVKFRPLVVTGPSRLASTLVNLAGSSIICPN